MKGRVQWQLSSAPGVTASQELIPTSEHGTMIGGLKIGKNVHAALSMARWYRINASRVRRAEPSPVSSVGRAQGS